MTPEDVRPKVVDAPARAARRRRPGRALPADRPRSVHRQSLLVVHLSIRRPPDAHGAARFRSAGLRALHRAAARSTHRFRAGGDAPVNKKKTTLVAALHDLCALDARDVARADRALSRPAAGGAAAGRHRRGPAVRAAEAAAGSDRSPCRQYRRRAQAVDRRAKDRCSGSPTCRRRRPSSPAARRSSCRPKTPTTRTSGSSSASSIRRSARERTSNAPSSRNRSPACAWRCSGCGRRSTTRSSRPRCCRRVPARSPRRSRTSKPACAKPRPA